MTPFAPTPLRLACLALAAAPFASLPARAQTPTPTPPAAAVDANNQQVEVIGLRRSLKTTEDIKREATQVVDSINATDIGAFPDRSIGDALQRVAGVQVTRDMGEVANVIIRGLPDVSTTVNGLEVFTGRGRRISYQDLPVTAVSGLDVYKSLTADLLEGGIAGSINVRLTAPFDLASGLSAGGRVDLRRTDPQGSSASKSFNDPAVGGYVSNRWSTPAGEFGALLDAYVQRDRYTYPVQWNDRPDLVWSVANDGNATRLGPGPGNDTPRPGERLATASHIGGIYNAGDRDRGSLHAAFQWRPDAQLEVTSHLLATGYKNRRETDYIFSIIGWTPNATNVVVAPVGPGCIPNGANPICSVVSSTNPRSQFGANPWNTDPFTATSTQAFDEDTRTTLGSLGVLWRSGNVRLRSDASFGVSKFERDMVIVDQQVLGASSQTYSAGSDGHGGLTSVTNPNSQTPLRDPSQFVLRGLVQGWNIEEGKQFQWRNDAEWTVGEGLLRKVLGGVRLSDRRAEARSAERASDISDAARPSPSAAFGADFDRLVPGIDRMLGPFQTPSIDFLLDRTDTVRAFYGAAAGRLPTDPTRSFEQTERSATGYLQGRLGAEFGDVSVLANAGVRLVRVERDLKGTTQTVQAAPLPTLFTPIDVETSETNVLPSVSGVVNWSDSLQSHFSAGRTITRPDFADLNPALSLIPPTVNQFGFGNAGNPDLKPVKSDSYDATLEYYFKRNGYVQVAAFDRRIEGFLQPLRRNELYNGVAYEVTRPGNSKKGRLYGLELGGQAFFDFLPAPFNSFGLQANYTRISGWNETPTGAGGSFVRSDFPNVAKHSANVVLLFQGYGLTGRLAATQRGEYLETLSEPPFNLDNRVRAATYVDFSIGYAINKNVALQFDAVNITHEKYRSFIGDASRARDIRYTPALYSIGVKVAL